MALQQCVQLKIMGGRGFLSGMFVDKIIEGSLSNTIDPTDLNCFELALLD
tara:strand:+ start:339 stop:488 length:150 start_codon:yes stop_codon:yes gene_type:complete